MKRKLFLGALLSLSALLALAANADPVAGEPFSSRFAGGVPAAEKLAAQNPMYMRYYYTPCDPNSKGMNSYIWVSLSSTFIACFTPPDDDVPAKAKCVAHINPAYPHFPLPRQ